MADQMGEEKEEQAFRTALEEISQTYAAHPFIAKSYLLSRPGKVTRLPGFSSGLIQVQDPGSHLVAQLCQVQPGQKVLDLCAAPGGKSMVLAKAAGPHGQVIAAELNKGRGEKITENAKRMGLKIEVRFGDARETVLGESDRYDVVLLDAPCSGLGTTRRKPEVKWKSMSQLEESLLPLQRELLEKAASVVKPGGTLVYAVCSPIPQEGKANIAHFVRENPDFSVVDPQAILPKVPADALDKELNIRLRTHRHLSDGFFMSRLVRHESTESP
jgi:16S rRNA (cytosine967-C5)-methyltransferase